MSCQWRGGGGGEEEEAEAEAGCSRKDKNPRIDVGKNKKRDHKRIIK